MGTAMNDGGTRRPVDRSSVLTEQRNARSMRLHEMSVAEIVALIQEEDRGVLEAMAAGREALSALIHAIEPRFTAGGRLIYLGAGTSGRLGVLDAAECPPTFQIPHGRVVGIIAGGDGALRRSSEGLEDDVHGAAAELESLRLTARDSVVGIAAGGTTPYVLGGLARAKRETALTGLIACSAVSEEASAVIDHVVCLPTGAEVVTGSTRMKAGTATKMALNTITTALMVRSGRVYENLMVDVRATNEKLRDRAARIVMALTGLDRDGSFALLDRAGGAVKTAVVMHRRGLERDAAEALLETGDGHLDRALAD